MSWTPDGLRVNAHGFLVRQQKHRERRGAVERFFDHIQEQASDLPEPCWIWTRSELFRVDDFTLMRPWRFIYELMEGRRVPAGAGWTWRCENQGRCCQPDHLAYKGQYCRSIKD